ncbi:hypothetical protein BT69DRAFT_1297867 [Atractiella rhizophila]|nr:hypothetical protein BT69DRAFT_1297867 [Atractiella rhizophila]
MSKRTRKDSMNSDTSHQTRCRTPDPQNIATIELDSSDDDVGDSIRRSPRKHARELPRGVDFKMDSSFDGWKDDEIIGWSSSETPSKSFSDITIDFDIQRWGRSKVQKNSNKPSVYLHYHKRPILRCGTYLKDTRSGRKSGELRIFYTFVCKTNPNHTYERARDDGSTKGLQVSADKCVEGDEGSSKSQQTKLVVSENQLLVNAMDQTDRDTYRRVLAALWCTTSARPFNFTHDHYFREILKLGNGGSESVPNIDCHRVVEDAKFLQEYVRAKVKARISAAPGNFFIMVDGWTAPQDFSYVLVYLHFREWGDAKKVALGFIRYKVLRYSYEVCERVMAPRCDSASNNDTFTMAMENRVKYPKMLLWRADLRVRCFDHILNLVAKGFLSRFKEPVRKKRVIAGIGTSVTADEVALSQLEAELRESGFTEEAELEDQSEEVQAQAAAIDLIREEAAPKATCSPKEELEARFMLTKLANLAKRTALNDGLRSKLDDEVAALQKEDPEGPLKFLSPPVHLVKACPTRWNGEGFHYSNISALKLTDTQVLHPNRRAAYLKKLDWEEAWIMEAMDSLQEFQQQHYKAKTGNSASTSVPRLRKKARTLYELDAMIDDADDTSTADYLVEFIKGVPLPIKTLQDDSGTTELDGLKYHYQWPWILWQSQVLATSVDVERAFSGGRLMVSYLRHQLSDPVFCSAMMLKLWEQDGFMPPMKELFGAVKQNDRKKRKGAEAARKKVAAEAEQRLVEYMDNNIDIAPPIPSVSREPFGSRPLPAILRECPCNDGETLEGSRAGLSLPFLPQISLTECQGNPFYGLYCVCCTNLVHEFGALGMQWFDPPNAVYRLHPHKAGCLTFQPIIAVRRLKVGMLFVGPFGGFKGTTNQPKLIKPALHFAASSVRTMSEPWYPQLQTGSMVQAQKHPAFKIFAKAGKLAYHQVRIISHDLSEEGKMFLKAQLSAAAGHPAEFYNAHCTVIPNMRAIDFGIPTFAENKDNCSEVSLISYAHNRCSMESMGERGAAVIKMVEKLKLFTFGKSSALQDGLGGAIPSWKGGLGHQAEVSVAHTMGGGQPPASVAGKEGAVMEGFEERMKEIHRLNAEIAIQVLEMAERPSYIECLKAHAKLVHPFTYGSSKNYTFTTLQLNVAEISLQSKATSSFQHGLQSKSTLHEDKDLSTWLGKYGQLHVDMKDAILGRTVVLFFLNHSCGIHGGRFGLVHSGEYCEIGDDFVIMVLNGRNPHGGSRLCSLRDLQESVANGEMEVDSTSDMDQRTFEQLPADSVRIGYINYATELAIHRQIPLSLQPADINTELTTKSLPSKYKTKFRMPNIDSDKEDEASEGTTTIRQRFPTSSFIPNLVHTRVAPPNERKDKNWTQHGLLVMSDPSYHVTSILHERLLQENGKRQSIGRLKLDPQDIVGREEALKLAQKLFAVEDKFHLNIRPSQIGKVSPKVISLLHCDEGIGHEELEVDEANGLEFSDWRFYERQSLFQLKRRAKTGLWVGIEELQTDVEQQAARTYISRIQHQLPPDFQRILMADSHSREVLFQGQMSVKGSSWKANTLGEAAEDSADLDQDNPVNMDFFTKDLSLDCLQEELEVVKGYYVAGKSLKSGKLKDLEGLLSMDRSLIRLDNIPAISNLLLSTELSDEQSQSIGTFKSPVHLFDLATKIEVAQTVESTAHILFRFAKYVQLSFRRRIHLWTSIQAPAMASWVFSVLASENNTAEVSDPALSQYLDYGRQMLGHLDKCRQTQQPRDLPPSTLDLFSIFPASVRHSKAVGIVSLQPIGNLPQGPKAMEDSRFRQTFITLFIHTLLQGFVYPILRNHDRTDTGQPVKKASDFEDWLSRELPRWRLITAFWKLGHKKEDIFWTAAVQETPSPDSPR